MTVVGENATPVFVIEDEEENPAQKSTPNEKRHLLHSETQAKASYCGCLLSCWAGFCSLVPCIARG